MNESKTNRFPGPRLHTALTGRVSWRCIPEQEAENMLRRIVAAREMAWLDDEIEGASNWLARLAQDRSQEPSE